MARKLVLVFELAFLAIVAGLQIGSPAPVSAAAINVAATCGDARYVSGRLQQDCNVTIIGPAPTGNQVFTTSGWATNIGTFHYMSTTPRPFSTPYPFSGTMTAAYADDVF